MFCSDSVRFTAFRETCFRALLRAAKKENGSCAKNQRRFILGCDLDQIAAMNSLIAFRLMNFERMACDEGVEFAPGCRNIGSRLCCTARLRLVDNALGSLTSPPTLSLKDSVLLAKLARCLRCRIRCFHRNQFGSLTESG